MSDLDLYFPKVDREGSVCLTWNTYVERDVIGLNPSCFSAECRVRSECTCWRSDLGLCFEQVSISEEQLYPSTGYF